MRGRKTWGRQGDFRKNIAHLSTFQREGGVPAQQLTRAPGQSHPRGAGIGLCRCWISLGALALACNVLRGAQHHPRCSEALAWPAGRGQHAAEEFVEGRSKIHICIPNHQDFVGAALPKLARNENYSPAFLVLGKYSCRQRHCLQLRSLTHP